MTEFDRIMTELWHKSAIIQHYGTQHNNSKDGTQHNHFLRGRVLLFIVILNTIILGVIMLNAIMQIVVAPFTLFTKMSHLCLTLLLCQSDFSSTIKCDKIYSND